MKERECGKRFWTWSFTTGLSAERNNEYYKILIMRQIPGSTHWPPDRKFNTRPQRLHFLSVFIVKPNPLWNAKFPPMVSPSENKPIKKASWTNVSPAGLIFGILLGYDPWEVSANEIKLTNFHQPYIQLVLSFVVLHCTCVWSKAVCTLRSHLKSAALLWGSNHTRRVCPDVAWCWIAISYACQVCYSSCPCWNVLTWSCSVDDWSILSRK